MRKILNDTPGPYSDFLLSELRSGEVKKKQSNSKGKSQMSAKIPPIQIIDSDSENNTIKVKGGKTEIDNVNLINDSDDDSIVTAEPNSVKPSPVKPKKHSKMPVIAPDEFSFFTNNKKQKPIVQKQESEDEYSEEESEEEEDSECSDSDSDTESNVSVNKEPKMSSREIEKRKQEILVKLLALEKKGVTLTKNYSLKSSLEELEFEYETQRYAAEVDASVHFQQKILMAAVTGAEFLNKKFDPIGAKLDGWSESVMDNITDYEEIFKKLHEKYKEKASMPPELQLLVTLVGSGFMFHLTNTLFKSSLPGLGDVLKTNPDIMNNIMGAMGKAMNNSQGLQQPQMGQQQMPQQQMPQQQMSQQQMSQQQQQQQFFNPSVITPPGQSQNNSQDFTGPSVNLSNLMNTYNAGPGKPISQKAPKQMNDDSESDRFSVASSSDFSESNLMTKSVTIPNRSNNSKKPKGKILGKSIKIN